MGCQIYVMANSHFEIRMAVVLKNILFLKPEVRILDTIKRNQLMLIKCSATNTSSNNVGEFRQLQLYPEKRVRKSKAEKEPIELTPRKANMNPEQDWTNTWPGPRTYHPSVVPLPIRQGRNKHGPPPEGVANTELMKIPNFLHLTPPAIEKHCKALKKFCTKWPESLKTDEDIEKHFPIEIITSDYCHSSSSIRDPKSRIMTLKIKLKYLELDEHAKDKFLRLVGPRYDPKTDYVTITTDSCPLKKQNYDYAYYLLTALYFESWKFEDWENEKSEDDMEKYIFSKRQSFKNVKAIFDYNNEQLPELKDFAKAVEDWHNNKDDPTIIGNYKQAVLKLLSLPPLESVES